MKSIIMVKKYLLIIAILCISTCSNGPLWTALHDDVGNSGPGLSGPPTLPDVMSVSPADGAANIAETTTIDVSFSDAMNPLSLTMQASGGACSGSIQISSDDFTTCIGGTINTIDNIVFTATPSANLAYCTTYNVRVTTDALDIGGAGLAADYTQPNGFSIVGNPNCNPPTVVSVTPLNGAVNVAVSTTVTATFSDTMDASTIISSNFTLYAGGTQVTGNVTYDAGTKTATFTPSAMLAGSTLYTATETTGVRNATNAHLAVNYPWSFTTIDTTVPYVTSTDPVNNATGIALNKVISANFSEAMDLATITSSTFVVRRGTKVIPGTLNYSGLTATFTPSCTYMRYSTYTVTITSGAKDVAGNAIAADYVFSFQPINTFTSYTLSEYPTPTVLTTATGFVPDQAFVIHDDTNYKLYYAGDDFASIKLAQSDDGINWTPYVSGNLPNDWIINDAQYHSDVKYFSAGFTGANLGTDTNAGTMHYRIWYQGLSGAGISSWRYAESPDGKTWYNRMAVTQTGTPVYSTNISMSYGIADVVYTEGAANSGIDWTFRIYVNAQYAVAPYGSNELTVMAFSSNGYVWTGYDPTSAGYATPVFAPTLDGISFDCDHIGWFKVIKNSPTDWEAFYSGGKGTTYQALNGIGYATSADGINWMRKPDGLITTADVVPAWRSNSVWMPSVVNTECNYQLWFLGSDATTMSDGSWIWWKVGLLVLTPQ
jgi:hypothetical protein